jgi:hypothetical protein
LSEDSIQLCLNHQPFVDSFWSSWFSTRVGLGREVFDGDRRFLNSVESFKNYVKWAETKRHAAWLTVQPFTERNGVSSVEKLFFDFDCPEDLTLAWRDTILLVRILRENYRCEPFVCFSGAKGYHVYAWLGNVENFSSQTKAKQFYRNAQKMILKGLDLKTFDTQVLGDIKRFSRVPYTVHQKSLKLCVPIAFDRKPVQVHDLNFFKIHGLSRLFSDLCRENVEKQDRNQVRHSIPTNQEVKDVRPCLSKVLHQNLTGKNGHSIRIAITIEFLKNGHSIEETASLFENQPDYSFDRSLYYVRDIAGRAYKPYKCSTILDLGFCLHDCPKRRNQREVT